MFWSLLEVTIVASSAILGNCHRFLVPFDPLVFSHITRYPTGDLLILPNKIITIFIVCMEETEETRNTCVFIMNPPLPRPHCLYRPLVWLHS